MIRGLITAALAIACIAGVFAQQRPDFAGRWKAANSFDSWTITVEGSRMTVTLTVAGNSESTVYMLDGTPVVKKIEGPAGVMENVYTSTWEGDVLVTTIKAPNMERIERRSIEADGSMRVQTLLTMLQGKPAPPPPPGVAAGMVFTRVGAQAAAPPARPPAAASPATPQAAAPPVKAPDTPAGRALTEFVDSFNADTKTRLTWLETRTTLGDAAAELAKTDAQLLEKYGALSIARIIRSAGESVEAVVRHSPSNMHGVLTITVEPKAPYKVVDLGLRAATAEEIKGGGGK